MGINKQDSTQINRRNILKKLATIAAGGIFANLALPTDAMGPTIELSDKQQQESHERLMKVIASNKLNSTIPCDDRTTLWQYLEDHDYIREYTRHQWIHDLPLNQQHQGQLITLLEPIIQDRTNGNDAVYNLLHHLIKREMRKSSLTEVKYPGHRQLIRQLEDILPQGNKPYTHHYVDPSIIKLLNEASTQSLLSLTHVHHDKSYHTPEYHDDVSEIVDDIYEINGIKKYSHSYARTLLEKHNIGLRSSSMGVKEVGNNRSSNRSSLVGINASSIDGIIALIEDIRKRWNYHQTEYITGGTEFGIHKPGPDGHEGGWKLDLGESLLVLIILLEQGITKYGSVIIGNYEYIFDYHGPDRHLDISIKEIILNGI